MSATLESRQHFLKRFYSGPRQVLKFVCLCATVKIALDSRKTFQKPARLKENFEKRAQTGRYSVNVPELRQADILSVLFSRFTRVCFIMLT